MFKQPIFKKIQCNEDGFYWFLGMDLLQYITFCCKQLSLRGQEVFKKLQEDFDDFDQSFLKTLGSYFVGNIWH